MDSETIAHLCAQQKHHRFMMFGKKQRYIEVFQCSGDDMNMVLHGAQFQPPNSNISKPPLLSPGMLQQPQSTQQAALSLPVSPSVPPLTLSIPQIPVSQSPSAALIAQQQAQAQFIAQQNLLARQQAVAQAQAQQAQAQQSEQLLLQQLGYYTTPPPSNPPPGSGLSPTSAAQLNSLQLASQLGPQMVYMSRGMMPGGFNMGSMGYHMGGLGGFPGLAALQGYSGMGPVVTGLPPTPAMSPMSPTYSTAYTSPLIMSPSNQSLMTAATQSSGGNTSRKRGYDSAFQGDASNMTNSAKRQYSAPPPPPSQAQMQAQAAAATAAFYSQYYPPPM